jgi:hypothetical protein
MFAGLLEFMECQIVLKENKIIAFFFLIWGVGQYNYNSFTYICNLRLVPDAIPDPMGCQMCFCVCFF